MGNQKFRYHNKDKGNSLISSSLLAAEITDLLLVDWPTGIFCQVSHHFPHITIRDYLLPLIMIAMLTPNYLIK